LLLLSSTWTNKCWDTMSWKAFARNVCPCSIECHKTNYSYCFE
jgi:hypothetical protein